MSQPDPDPKITSPAIPAPEPKPQAEEEFDLLAFWIQHRTLIFRLLYAAIIGVIIYGAWLFMDYRKRAGSEDALANATTSAELRKVTQDWSGTPAAGSAYLRLADSLRTESKPAEAASVLREFLDKYPVHPLRATAAHGVAAALETAGDLNGALAAYQSFVNAHAGSAFAPLGLVSQARILTAQGKLDEARRILEDVEQRFRGNPFAMEAGTLLDEIRNPAGRQTGGAPRPTPPPAPAPPSGAPAGVKIEPTPAPSPAPAAGATPAPTPEKPNIPAPSAPPATPATPQLPQPKNSETTPPAPAQPQPAPPAPGSAPAPADAKPPGPQ